MKCSVLLKNICLFVILLQVNVLVAQDDSKRLTAKFITEDIQIRILYNETTLYVGIRAESDGKDYVVTSLRRDYRGSRNDNVSILFDTFNDGTNAFGFGMTPYLAVSIQHGTSNGKVTARFTTIITA